jgi:hypothetical protein
MLTAAVLPLFFILRSLIDANPVDFNWSQIPLIPQLNKRHLKSIGIWISYLRIKSKRHANFNKNYTHRKKILAPFHFLILLFITHPCIVQFIRKYFRTWKVHSEQQHTADVLFSRLFCILFWFNPIVWLYKSNDSESWVHCR